MAKNTHSQEVLTGTSESYTSHELTDPIRDGVALPEYTEETELEVEVGDSELAGTGSSRSSNPDQKSSDTETVSHQSPAQTTDSHSRPTEPGASSTAPTTGTSGRKATPSRSGKRARSRTIPDTDDFD